ncbi:MAG TPA: glucose-6-phosphate dehydrogenase [Alloiococcus sp.]|nr:glucose-6-phosphate dehydrogenase [Alloiococcus sp.]
MTVNEKVLFTLFGATGDLAARKLYPAIYHLFKKNCISKCFALIGTGRREWTTEYYRNIVREAIADIDDNKVLQEEFADHFYYKSHDVTNVEEYEAFKDFSDEVANKHNIGGNRLFYLSMSPSFFKVITENLKEYGFLETDGFNRVIVEKPFGEDEASAIQLEKDLRNSINIKDLFFIDHYLGKPMIKNILTMRFSNPLLKAIWNKEHIDNIQITLAEEVSVEARGDFYDKTGAIKDMVQNHILQCFSLLTMDEPLSLCTKDILESKVKALENIDLNRNTLVNSTVRGQYVAYRTENEESYTDNERVDDNSKTETFIAGKIEIKEGALSGVPVYYRTGKRMSQKMTRLDIVFKDAYDSLFDNNQNVLTVLLDPEETIYLTMNAKEQGLTKELHKQTMKVLEAKNDIPSPSAYESLIKDAIKGDQVNFSQFEEIIASWKYVDSIKAIWEETNQELLPYEVYTDGPVESFSLLEKDNHYWIF